MDIKKNRSTYGRLTVLLIDSIIYPLCLIFCGFLCYTKIISGGEFIAILGAYALLVKETRKEYFDRSDRAPEELQPGKPEVIGAAPQEPAKQ